MIDTINQIIKKFNNESTPIVKELEFRSEEGKFVFSIKGEQTDHLYGKLLMIPELNKTTKKLEGQGEVIVLEVIAACEYTIGGFVSFKINKGGYIKVITK